MMTRMMPHLVRLIFLPVVWIEMSSGQYALIIIESLSCFADKQSNLVLDILNGQIPHENEKFPEGELNFAGAGWRGFYHCHASVGKNPNEHGHFHLFVHCNAKQGNSSNWTHVAALSIDNEGQPRSWFTVNQWVTGANWLSADETITLLDGIQIPDEANVTEKFLLAMLGLYHDDLEKLLLERDRQLTRINADRKMDDTLCDRNVYMLSQQSIELQQRLNLAVMA